MAAAVTKAMLYALQATGCEILEEDYNGFIVIRKEDDESEIIFAEPQVHIGEIEEEIKVEHSRFDFEEASCMYLAFHDEISDCRVMFSIAQLFILIPRRGILRHVIDWTNSSDIKCRWDIIHVEEGR